MKLLCLILCACMSAFAFSVQAATLGLSTSAPTIGATGEVEYIEFGPDGDISMFGAPITVSSLTTLEVPTAELDFGVGFSLANPVSDASGGFSIFDGGGEYLAGDLLAIGFRGFGATRSIIELQFGNLTGRGAPEWTENLLMNVIFNGLGDDPLAAMEDGDVFDVEIGMFAVQGGITDPDPSPVPLPASGLLMLAAFGGILAMRRKKQ